MCYNVEAKALALKKYEAYFKGRKKEISGELDLDIHLANGFLHPVLPVIVQDEEDPVKFMHWGLVPPWCKDEKQAKELQDFTLNARAETIFEKPSFRSIVAKRCLLPITGFYEWRTFNKKKYPYYIHLKSKEPFALGCLYDEWVNRETGEILTGFSIVTTEANPLMAKIHNDKRRMPLILPEKAEKEWIDPGLSKEKIKQLLLPFDEALMEAYTISRLITNRKENPNEPEVSLPQIYSELDPL